MNTGNVCKPKSSNGACIYERRQHIDELLCENVPLEELEDTENILGQEESQLNADKDMLSLVNTKTKLASMADKMACFRNHCECLEKHLSCLIEDWIGKHLYPSSINKMFDNWKALRKNDNHKLLNELDDLIEISKRFNMELVNIFDNYVCFAGMTSTKQLDFSVCMASQRSVELLKTKNHIHNEFTSRVHGLIIHRMCAFYEEANTEIISKEVNVSKKLTKSLIQEYDTKMQKHMNMSLDNLENLQYIFQLHGKIKSTLVSIAKECLIIEGKQNNIVNDCVRNLARELDSKLQSRTVGSDVADFEILSYREKLETCIEDYCKKMYLDEMLVLDNCTESLVDRHDKIVEDIKLEVYNKHLVGLLPRLDTHLSYATENIEQLKFKGTRNTTPFCLLLTDQWFNVRYQKESNIKEVKYGTNKCSLPPAKAVLTSDKKIHTGFNVKQLLNRSQKPHIHFACTLNILDYFCEHTIDDIREDMAIKFFKDVKNDVDIILQYDNFRAVVILPSLVNAEGRIRLRNIVRKAGIKEIFIVAETSLLAYHRLCPLRNVSERNRQKAKVLVAIQIDRNGIRLEVFVLVAQNHVELSAVAFVCWPDELQSISCMTEDYISKHTDFRTYKSTLEKAISLAYLQIDSNLSTQVTEYCIITNMKKLDNVFDDFLKERKAWSKIIDFRFQDVMPAVTSFLDNPKSLISKLPNHAFNTIYFNYIEQKYYKPYQVADTIHNLAVPKDELLKKKKDELIESCKMMRAKLEANSNIHTLIRKIIMEVIERAELISTDEHSTKQMVDAEDKELEELAYEHGLNLSVTK